MARGYLRSVAKRSYLELLRGLPDAMAVRLDYFRVLQAFPDLANPKRFSEKIQHLKLNVRDPRMPMLVDKIQAKKMVSERLGSNWIIPTIWHGEKTTPELLRGLLTPAVLKPNHSSGNILFLNRDSNFEAASRIANAWLKYDHHVIHREWSYGSFRREVLAEPLIGGGEPPDDYKFWTFDGEVELIQVDLARFRHHTRQFFSPEWTRLAVSMRYPGSREETPAPQHLQAMLNAARTLSQGFRFARVDLYDVASGPLFGELTFAPEAGLCRFKPPSFDLELGRKWAYPAPGHARQGMAGRRMISGPLGLNRSRGSEIHHA
jgi:hypothetical protein